MGQRESRLSVLLRPFSAAVLTVVLPLSGIIGSVTVPAAKAIGVSGAAGDIANCGEIGFLVAVAGKSKQTLGRCPLKHTDVNAEVAGFVSRVTVKQQFHNPYKEKIEAVYTFPLPENAAVDEMTMKIGNRVIKGSIKQKEEAREIYDAAKRRGHVASLLDQERPNIFTQAVANIEPGQNIDIELKYVNILKYDSGAFTFSFPTVVGPRFMPGDRNGRSGPGTSSDTDDVPDASRISPPNAPQGERAGHDISIAISINSAVPIDSINSKLHQVNIVRQGPAQARVSLKPSDKIPNRDFVVSWNVAADQVRSGYLAHGDEKGGVFSLILVPPKRVTPKIVAPKEMVFLIDCSGSQAGPPIQKAKETMNYILDHMNPNDTFQIITFNNNATFFAHEPQPCSAATTERAHRFLESLRAEGGTWMASAVEEACNLPNPENRLRIVTFMTDGFVGNDFEIISMIKKHRGRSRWFSFGTGNSVNRFLIDKIAAEGGGESEYVLLNSSAEEVGKKFYDRISSPVLTDISVQFTGVDVKEVYPKEQTDLWAQRPLCLTGRYLKPGQGKVILTGYSGGKPYKQEIPLSFAGKQPENAVLKSIWARAKVDRLMSEDWLGMQSGHPQKELKEEIIATALKYHIMTQFTSFVAVEDDCATAGGAAKTVNVPVEVPQGMQAQTNSIQPLPYPTSTSYRRVKSLGTLAPVVAASGGRSSYPASLASGSERRGGLPTNMGKFVHLPGDTQYSQSYSSRSDTGASQNSAPTNQNALSNSGLPSLAPSSLATSVRTSGFSDSAFGDEGAPGPAALGGLGSGGGSGSGGGGSGAGSAYRVESVDSAAFPYINEKNHGNKRKVERSGQTSATDKLSTRPAVISAELTELIMRLEQRAKGRGKDALFAKRQLSEPYKIKITLREIPAKDLLASLKSLGFKLEKVQGSVLLGQFSLSKIENLAKLENIERIEKAPS
ncbi:MAG: VIT and VWA domain-containing protein [Candidatus Obscuribacterales bacterium]|jgi:Ca-activated chloride channel family protein|nr:VIT and VWA domain-containing protein [Candidatus Obscuribacterales bacterium]